MEAAEIEKELEELEVKLDQLRGLYEQYFMGMERIEPQQPRRDIDRRIKVLRKEQLRNTAQRFKFNTLVMRMNTMAQMWGRITREIENGTYKRDVIRAAARFGEGAVAALGKKAKGKDVAAAVARAQSKMKGFEDTFELSEDDLVEENDLAEEDEAPTPSAMGPQAAPNPAPARPAQSVQHAYVMPADYGLAPTDLPLVASAAPQAAYPAQTQQAYPYAAPVPGYVPPAAGSQPVAPAPYGALPAPNAPPRRDTGVHRLDAPSDPGSAVRPAAAADPRQRVADLAAEMRGTRAQPAKGGFGELDLDFDDGPSGERAVAPQPAAPAPAARTTTPAARAPAAAAARPAAQQALSGGGGFGVLDIALDDDLPPTPAPAARPAAAAAQRPATATSNPGSGVRPGAASPAAARPAAQAQRPAAAAPAPAAAPSGGDLNDQRIRQIYAKYVETKRDLRESTAGVTFDKLASQLRAQADKLKESHPNKAIDYEVVIKNGKTTLKPVLK